MKKIALLLLSIFIISCQNDDKKTAINFTTLFEKSNGTETPEYKDVIEYYTNLADEFSEISLFEIGKTDSDKPLHLIVFNIDEKST